MDSSGPAFPISIPGWGDNGCSGMTLRDYFAAAALTGLLAASCTDDWKQEDILYEAYRYADAMLAQRKEGQDGA